MSETATELLYLARVSFTCFVVEHMESPRKLENGKLCDCWNCDIASRIDKYFKNENVRLGVFP
jgi:hypothetical protein